MRTKQPPCAKLDNQAAAIGPIVKCIQGKGRPSCPTPEPPPPRRSSLRHSAARSNCSDVPYIPLGAFFLAVAYRSDLTGGIPFFTNVRRTWCRIL